MTELTSVTENVQSDIEQFGTDRLPYHLPESISFRSPLSASETSLGGFLSVFIRSTLCGLMLCGCGDSGNTVAPPPTKTASTPGAPDENPLNSESPPKSPSSSENVKPSENAATDSSSGAAADSSSATNGDSSAAAGAAAMETYDGMKFSVPASWKKLPLSAMQQGIIAAKFGIPEFGDDISLTLSTSGGSLEDNLKRWEGQFSGGDPMSRETLSIGGDDCTLVRLQGRFSPGFGRPDGDNWKMLGVIIPMTGQNYCIKLTGPQDAVSKAESQFLEFSRSARRE